MKESLSSTIIRQAEPADLPAVVRVHLATFPGFYLTDLGPAFLRAYYRLVLSHEGGRILLAEVDGTVAAFVAGFRDPAGFYRRMSASKWQLALPIAWGLLRNPALLMRTVRNVLRVRSAQREPALAGSDSCELSSMAVAPQHARNGLGARLASQFIADHRVIGVRKIRLTTDAENNDAAHRFYRSCGFEAIRTFEAAGGRWMCEYVLLLESQSESLQERLLAWRNPS